MSDPIRSDNPKFPTARPRDPYDPLWSAWNAAHPQLPRSVGAAAANEGGDGGALEGGDGGSAGGDTQPGGDGGDTQPGGEGGERETKLGGGQDTLGGGEGGDEGKGAADWRTGLADDLKPVAEKFTSPADVVKSYAELQKRLGRSVLLPGKDAKPEEVAAFHKALGVPEKPEGYEVEIPKERQESWSEADEALKGSFVTALHGAGAPPAVVSAAMSWYFETLGKMEEERAKTSAEATAKMDAELQKEWGDDAKVNDQYGARAAKQFGGEGFLEFLETKEVDGVKLGDHPTFRRAFAEIGRKMAEGRPLVEGDSDEAKTIQERINEIHELQHKEPAKYGSKPVQDELQSLYGKLYGGQPIVGADGRTN